MSNPKWLQWAQSLEALAQAGLTYSANPFDIERYHHIRQIAAQIVSEYTHEDLPVIEEIYARQSGYTTPKLDARGVVFRDGKILLVKELLDRGRWTLPGGWVDVNEPPSRAVEREVFEESGYTVKAQKLLALLDRNQHGFPPFLFHTFKIFILCSLESGSPTTSIETGGAEFFAEDALPELSTARTTPQVLQRLFEHHRHPEWPTDFD